MRPHLRLLLPAALAVLVAFVSGAAPRFARPYPSEHGHLVLAAAAGALVVASAYVLAEATLDLLVSALAVSLAVGPSVLAGPGSFAAETVDVVALVLFTGAATAFARRAIHGRRPLDERLSAAASCAAVACAAEILAHSPLVADLLFLVASTSLLVGAVHETRERSYRRAAVPLVARQRAIAQELHDALGQELALLVTYTSTMESRGMSEPVVGEIRDAAQRALDDARRAMSVLGTPMDEEPTQARPESLTDVLARSLPTARNAPSNGSTRT